MSEYASLRQQIEQRYEEEKARAAPEHDPDGYQLAWTDALAWVLTLLPEAEPAPSVALWRGFEAGFHARRVYANFAPPRWAFSPCGVGTVDEAYAAFLATVDTMTAQDRQDRQARPAGWTVGDTDDPRKWR